MHETFFRLAARSETCRWANAFQASPSWTRVAHASKDVLEPQTPTAFSVIRSAQWIHWPPPAYCLALNIDIRLSLGREPQYSMPILWHGDLLGSVCQVPICRRGPGFRILESPETLNHVAEKCSYNAGSNSDTAEHLVWTAAIKHANLISKRAYVVSGDSLIRQLRSDPLFRCPSYLSHLFIACFYPPSGALFLAIVSGQVWDRPWAWCICDFYHRLNLIVPIGLAWDLFCLQERRTGC